MIVVDELTKVFGRTGRRRRRRAGASPAGSADARAPDTGAGAHDAVSGISFRVEAGEFVGYAGPNGAGKSTTVKMLTGVLTPTSGSATVCGLVPWIDRAALNLRSGVVFGQRTQLWWDLPLRESFDLLHRLYRTTPIEHGRDLDDLVDRLDLGTFLDRPVRNLSLGQRMRAELAAAVLPRPEILFLDEPTIGLDVEAKAVVRSFLAERNRDAGMTVLLTTHDTDDIIRLCRRLLIIDDGKIISDGTVADLVDRFGDSRRLIIDLARDDEFTVADATEEHRSGLRRWLTFSTTDVSAPEMVARVLAATEVADLTLEGADLEDVIRRIYRDGTG